MATGASRAKLLRECLDSFDELEAAEAALRDQMRRLRTAIRQGRTFLADGGETLGLRELINIGALRTANDEALRTLESARLRTQHALYRLANADGVNAADIGRTWGVSRQLVSRILNEPPRRS